MRSLTVRPRRLLPTVAVIAVAISACSSSGSKTSSTTASKPTVASQLVLGAAPECPQRPFCIPGLTRVYGVTFKQFKALDAAGPLTYAAITSGQIDVAEVFSTDGLIADKGLVVLQDDKHLQNADNIVPVIRTAKNTSAVDTVLNAVSAKLTTEGLTSLNKSITVDKADPADVATTFLKAQNLDTKSSSLAGVTLKIGSFNFSESALLADIYGKALQAAGASVTIKTNLGTRETVEPGLQSGQIDLVPEYAATALEFINKGAGEASGDVAATTAKLRVRFEPLGITALEPSEAVDTNAFAVTKATADKYHLSKMSDLANPTP